MASTSVSQDTKKFTRLQKLEQDIRNLQRRIYSPKVDLINKRNHYRVRIELPGVESDTVKVQIKENRIVLISCKKQMDDLEEDDLVVYREARYEEFTRRVKLPGNVKEIDFSNHPFTINNGVLIVDFEKEPQQTQEPSDWADA